MESDVEDDDIVGESIETVTGDLVFDEDDKEHLVMAEHWPALGLALGSAGCNRVYVFVENPKCASSLIL